MTLSRRLVEDERRRDRDVERFDRRAASGCVTVSCDGRHRRLRHAGAFAAEHDGRRLAEVELAAAASRRAARPRRAARRARAPRPTTSASEPRAAIGRRKVPPIAPRSAFQLNGFAEPSIATTPDAPNAAAARTIAPTLPGSCSPARTSTSGRSVTVAMTTRTSVGRARAIATTPDGCCDRADRREHLIAARSARGRRAPSTSLASARRARARWSERDRRTPRSRSGTSHSERLLHQVLAVEQDLGGDAGSRERLGVGPGRPRVRARSRNRLTIAFCRLRNPFHPCHYSIIHAMPLSATIAARS